MVIRAHVIPADVINSWAKKVDSNVFRIEIMGDARVGAATRDTVLH